MLLRILSDPIYFLQKTHEPWWHYHILQIDLFVSVEGKQLLLTHHLIIRLTCYQHMTRSSSILFRCRISISTHIYTHTHTHTKEALQDVKGFQNPHYEVFWNSTLSLLNRAEDSDILLNERNNRFWWRTCLRKERNCSNFLDNRTIQAYFHVKWFRLHVECETLGDSRK
jgi:hypothetical protein